MTKTQIKAMIQSIETNLKDADMMFKTESQSHAYIIGYLEGTLKTIRGELQSHSSKK